MLNSALPGVVRALECDLSRLFSRYSIVGVRGVSVSWITIAVLGARMAHFPVFFRFVLVRWCWGYYRTSCKFRELAFVLARIFTSQHFLRSLSGVTLC
jgi:hypothetical protein